MVNKSECYQQALQRIRDHRHLAEEQAATFRAETLARHPQLSQMEKDMISLMLKRGVQPDDEPLRQEYDALAAHRADYLQAAGIAESQFSPAYDCPRCHDTGYVDGKLCACVHNAAHERMLRQLCRDLPIQDFTFDAFSLDYYAKPEDRAKMAENLSFCRRYAENFSPDAPSLYILGETGLGKTHLTFAMARQIVAAGYEVIYASAQTMITELEHEHFGQADLHAQDLYLNAELLILDDLGTEFLSQVAQSELYHVIDNRLLAHRPTVINSNLTPKELEARYGERLASRILGCYTTLRFCGKDIRIQKRLASKKM